MTQCVARAIRSGERCGNDALEGQDKCGVHGAMPSNHEEISRLKTQAYRVGYVVISQSEHRELLDDGERLRKMQVTKMVEAV